MRPAKYVLRLAFTHSATGENKFCGLEKIFCKPHFFTQNTFSLLQIVSLVV